MQNTFGLYSSRHDLVSHNSLYLSLCIHAVFQYIAVCYESEEKMQEKLKMILSKNENLVHVQQRFGVPFCEKIDSKSGFS